MSPALHITRTNTILYCDRWAKTVAFYCDRLGLTKTHTSDWFVEVHLYGSAHLSLADAARSTIAPAHGAGITLSWQVPSVEVAQTELTRIGITVSDIKTRWNTSYVELVDPEHTRIELWSPKPV